MNLIKYIPYNHHLIKIQKFSSPQKVVSVSPTPHKWPLCWPQSLWINLPVLAFHVNEIIQKTLFGVLFLPHKTMFWRFNHVVACIIVPFFNWWLIFSYMNRSQFVYPLVLGYYEYRCCEDSFKTLFVHIGFHFLWVNN